MRRRHSCLRLFNNFIRLPWARLATVVFVILVSIWLWAKFTRCNSVVRYHNEEAEFALRQLRCSETDNARFPTIRTDCQKYQTRLDDDFQDDLWWTCFANTFYFYRTWTGMFTSALFVVVVWWIWSPESSYTQPIIIFREPTIEPYNERERSPERLKYSTYKRLPFQQHLQLTRPHASDDDD